MTTPVRLQLSRRKGFRLQAHSRALNGLPAVKCARRGKWGNPFVVGSEVASSEGTYKLTAEEAVRMYRELANRIDTDDEKERLKVWGTCIPPDLTTIVRELRGKNLACWCRLCQRHRRTGKLFGEHCADCSPCHTDTLLELANR